LPFEHFHACCCLPPAYGTPSFAPSDPAVVAWQINPYEPEVNWFSDDKEIMPLSAAPEPKRRFIPSKWEEKK